MGSIGMKYKESVQSSGSNNATANRFAQPGSATKKSSNVTLAAASVSGISGDINVNLMKMFDNSQKKKMEPESDSDSDRMDQNCDESYKGDEKQTSGNVSAPVRNDNSTIGSIMSYFRKADSYEIGK